MPKKTSTGSSKGAGSHKRVHNHAKRTTEQKNKKNAKKPTTGATIPPYTLGSWKSINPDRIANTGNIANWFQVACSFTGQYVAVIDANIYRPFIWTSNDYGNTYSRRNLQTHDYSGISVTDTGVICVPAIRDLIFVSVNYGGSFQPTNDPGGFWYKIATDGTGQIRFCVKAFNNSDGLTPNKVFKSINGGPFISVYQQPDNWSCVCVNQSGSTIGVCAYEGNVSLSKNTGNTWVSCNAPPYCWSGITLDSTGQNIAVCSLDGYIYYSNNGGRVWHLRTTGLPPLTAWSGIAMSADARVLFVCGINDYIYYSTNAGVKWTMTSPNGVPSNWYSIACNNDGSFVCASINGGNIYVINKN